MHYLRTFARNWLEAIYSIKIALQQSASQTQAYLRTLWLALVFKDRVRQPEPTAALRKPNTGVADESRPLDAIIDKHESFADLINKPIKPQSVRVLEIASDALALQDERLAPNYRHVVLLTRAKLGYGVQVPIEAFSWRQIPTAVSLARLIIHKI